MHTWYRHVSFIGKYTIIYINKAGLKQTNIYSLDLLKKNKKIMIIPLSNGCLASELALWVYAALKGYSCSISNKNEKIQKEMEYICFLSCLSIYLFLIFNFYR